MKSRVRGAVSIVLALAFVGLAAHAGYRVAHRSGLASLGQAATQRLDAYAATLQSELSRYDYLPAVLGLNEDLADALTAAGDVEARARADRYLETVAAEARASAAYLMDLGGLTVAASNWAQQDGFVGRRFDFRPYFRDAVRGGLGRFYGVGTVSREAGYYFASAVYRQGRMLGVAAVKVDLTSFDRTLARAGEVVLVVDEHGIVFLSSVPELKFRSLEPLTAGALQRLSETRQYHTRSHFAPVGALGERAAAPGMRFASLQPGGSGAPPGDYLVRERPVPGTTWRVLMLADTAPLAAANRNAAAAAGCAALALVLLLLYAGQRRRVAAQRAASKQALERAYGELEHEVARRTRDLSDANGRLQTEIGERAKAEAALKATLEELVQAGKMAALGQLATGITHELNQPLAALRTLSDNACVLLQRMRYDDVRDNLEDISALVQRMSSITSQLKNFARKAPPALAPVDLAAVIDDSLFLLGQRIRAQQVEVDVRLPEAPAVALCDRNRMQQVLVNLVGNAIDAMAGVPRRRLCIAVRHADERIALQVRDNGSGIAPEARGRLFEPFFSTKAQGEGLGLGLAISSGIVKEFGGCLRGRDGATGGAEFTVLLPAVAAPARTLPETAHA